MLRNLYNSKYVIKIKENPLWFSVLPITILLISIFFFFGFDDVFFRGPQGIHFMRQTDSLSFVSQYYNNGYDFFNPKLFNLKNIDGKAACEFPITYYLTAVLYSVFGKSPYLLKLIHLLILYVGVYYVYRLSYLLTKKISFSILITLFLFTSTVFNFYSFNYLPDSAALGLNLIGFYYIFHYFETNKSSSVATSFFFFSLGGLIKITYFINPLAVIALSLYSILYRKSKLISIKQAKKSILFGFLSTLPILLWYSYMLYYNNINESISFNTKPLPIWNLTKEEILHVWDTMINYWNSEYLAHPSMLLVAFMIFIQIIFRKKAEPILQATIFFLFLGNISYFILFYSQFKDHDYYALAFIPLVILLIINGIQTLANLEFRYKPIVQKISTVLFLLIVAYGINYSKHQMAKRHEIEIDEMNKISYLIQKNSIEIDKLNLPNDAKFIVAPDKCQNGGLFYLDKEGWNIEDPQNITHAKITVLKEAGADFLLVENSIGLEKQEEFGQIIYRGDGINIIKLQELQ